MNNISSFFKTLFITLLCCGLYYSASAQTANIEYLGDARAAGWKPTNAGYKPDSTNVWIQSGNLVIVDTHVTFKSMLIDPGAEIGSTGFFTVEPVSSNSILFNSGLLGQKGLNDKIDLLIPKMVKSFTLAGNGKTAIATLRPKEGNDGLTINIRQQVTLSGVGPAFSAVPITGQMSSDNITVNVDVNKDIVLENTSSQFHTTAFAGPAGNYTYNINGLVDVSASTIIQQILPYEPSSSKVTLNIGGMLRLGTGLNIAKPNWANGKLVLNILNGGIVDATRATTFTSGLNYFTTNGTGVLRRIVSGNDVIFPVGAPGSSFQSPILISNSGEAANVAVSVKNQFDVSPPNSTKVVNKQWIIIPEGSGITLGIKPVFGTIDVASGFSRTAPTAIYYRPAGSNTWESKTATLTGAGTVNSPYVAAATGFTKFGVFIVQNTGAGSDARVSLYPNPTSDVVNVDFPETTQESTVQITNYQGRNMAIERVKKGAINWKYNISSWPPGFYFLKMKGGDRESAIKFVKK
ncbi:MAG: T9SS type A sorting domain-containing protein [Mucilaginibacter sp.]